MQPRGLFCGSQACRVRSCFASVIALSLAAVLLGCGDDARSPTAPEAEPALALTASTALAFKEVSAGDIHACGVTTANRAYCWGWNQQGQLGDGTRTQRLVPTLVKGGLLFRQVSAGKVHTCGVTTENRAYCWGDDSEGQLGDGTYSAGPAFGPTAVLGGHLFRQVSAGSNHTCGVTTDDRAYCWGSNWHGQIGNGTSSTLILALTPVAVAGTLKFRRVSAAEYHSCGVTYANRAYCWGGDQWGQVGDGVGSSTCGLAGWPQACRKSPTLVAGGYQFRQVDAGGGGGPGEDGYGGTDGGRTCGVTTDDRAFCWGDGSHGQNGDGTLSIRSSPRLVAGGLHFRSVSAGLWHTCGVTTDDLAYCWGWNLFGQIGDGTIETMRLKPRAVLGGHLFRQVEAGDYHTCGTTPSNVAYCWGGGGLLGDGTTTGRLKPRAVVGPL
jgi:alpha-tubulin suppressor-like RCC1 family protein